MPPTDLLFDTSSLTPPMEPRMDVMTSKTDD